MDTNLYLYIFYLQIQYKVFSRISVQFISIIKRQNMHVKIEEKLLLLRICCYGHKLLKCLIHNQTPHLRLNPFENNYTNP